MTVEMGIIAVELVAKSTLILGLAYLVVRSFKRLAAAERHLILAFAVSATLALPVLAPFAPTIATPFPMFPASGLDADVSTSVDRDAVASERDDSADATSDAVPSQTTERNRSSLFDWSSGFSAYEILARIYFVVVLLILGYLSVNEIRMMRRARSLSSATNAETIELVESARRDFGIRRHVRVLVTSECHSPWAFGLVFPAIVLPSDFESWSIEQRKCAVIHELSHVSRLDQLSLWMGRVCCTLYWFHPFAWLVSIRMNREAERACDDQVLRSDVSTTAYARQLLDLANRIFSKDEAPKHATAMARTSSVSERIRSILDYRERRVTMNKLRASLIVTAGLLVVAPLAPLTSQESVSPASEAELAGLVRSYLDNDQRAQAAEAIADWIINNATCLYCTRQVNPTKTEEYAALLAALDQVEKTALETNDGEMFVRLAGITLATANDNFLSHKEAILRSGVYLWEAQATGDVGAISHDVALAYFVDAGRFEDALTLVEVMQQEQSRTSEESGLLESWSSYLSGRIEHSSALLDAVLGRQQAGVAGESENNEYVPVRDVVPDYPEEAMRAGLEGSALVEFTVTNDGSTRDVFVVSSTDSIFEQASIEAAREFEYPPTLIDGVAVEIPGVRNRFAFAMPDGQ